MTRRIQIAAKVRVLCDRCGRVLTMKHRAGREFDLAVPRHKCLKRESRK